MRNNLWNTVYTRIKDITIESEAVRSSVVVGWDRAAEPVQVDHLVTVVELENVSDGLDCLQVLIILGVEVVERLALSRVTV